MKKTTRRLLSAFGFAASIQSPALAADQPGTLDERLAPPPGGGLTAEQVAVRARETSYDAAASREAIRADAERMLSAFPDLVLEVRRTVASAQVVTQEWTLRAGRSRMELAGVSVADYDHAGRIERFSRYWSAFEP